MHIQEIIAKKQWESFISKHAPQSLFQSWNWGESLRNFKFQISNFKFPIWRVGIFDKDKLVGIAQIQKVVAKRGTFLHVRNGPILSEWNERLFSVFHGYIVSAGKKEGASFVRVSPLIANTNENALLFRTLGYRDAPMHAMDGEYCWVLDIDKTEEEILSGMRKTARYLIRTAEKIGVTIEKSSDSKDLKDFFTLYDETASRHGFVKHTGIREEFEQLSRDGHIMLFKGHYQKNLLSAALIIFYNHQAIYHHSASIEQKIPVNYLLQWEAIREAKKRGMQIYNFWGVSPAEKSRHPWRGLSLFKKGFGGRPVEYMHAKDFPLTSKYLWIYLLEWTRKMWKGY